MSESRISLGNLTIDTGAYRVWVDDELIELTYYEFEALALMLERQNQILSYGLLTEALWKETGKKQVRNLNVLIHRVRAKLSNSRPYSIETVRGRGYGLLLSAGDKGSPPQPAKHGWFTEVSR